MTLEEQLANLSSVISTAFSIQETAVSFAHVDDGLNRENHFCVDTASGNRYGLKIPIRGIPNGFENEKLMGDLSELLRCPNFCRVRQTNNIDFIEQFKTRIVNITQWHKDCVPIRVLSGSPGAILSNPANSATFFQQTGEWMSFGIAFGARDRHDGNFVWNRKGVSMIDMEASLINSQLADYRWMQHFISSDTIERLIQRDLFIAGYNDLQSKLTCQYHRVQVLLNSYPHSQNYQLQSIGLAVPTISDFLNVFFRS